MAIKPPINTHTYTIDHTAQQLLMLNVDNDQNVQHRQRTLCNKHCKNERPFCETDPNVDCEERG